MLKNPNRKSAKVHLNRLYPSDIDAVALAAAVQERFLDLTRKWIVPPPIGYGVPLLPPSHMDRAFMLWRTMCVRFKNGDYRHTEDELRATKEIAEWTLRCKAKLANQPAKKIEWKD